MMKVINDNVAVVVVVPENNDNNVLVHANLVCSFFGCPLKLGLRQLSSKPAEARHAVAPLAAASVNCRVGMCATM